MKKVIILLLVGLVLAGGSMAGAQDESGQSEINSFARKLKLQDREYFTDQALENPSKAQVYYAVVARVRKEVDMVDNINKYISQKRTSTAFLLNLAHKLGKGETQRFRPLVQSLQKLYLEKGIFPAEQEKLLSDARNAVDYDNKFAEVKDLVSNMEPAQEEKFFKIAHETVLTALTIMENRDLPIKQARLLEENNQKIAITIATINFLRKK